MSPIRPTTHRVAPRPGQSRVFKSPNQLSPKMLWGDQRIHEIVEQTPSVPRSNRGSDIKTGFYGIVSAGTLEFVDVGGDTPIELTEPGGGLTAGVLLKDGTGFKLLVGDGNGKVHKTRNLQPSSTGDWTEIADLSSAGMVSMDSDGGATVVAVFAGGRMQRSTDYGETWSDVAGGVRFNNGGIGGGFFDGGNIDKVRHDRSGLWIAYSTSLSKNYVFWSADGASWSTWDVSGLNEPAQAAVLAGRIAVGNGPAASVTNELVETENGSTIAHQYALSTGIAHVSRTTDGDWFAVDDSADPAGWYKVDPDGGGVVASGTAAGMEVPAAGEAWCHDSTGRHMIAHKTAGVLVSEDHGLTWTHIDAVGGSQFDDLFGYHLT